MFLRRSVIGVLLASLAPFAAGQAVTATGIPALDRLVAQGAWVRGSATERGASGHRVTVHEIVLRDDVGAGDLEFLTECPDLQRFDARFLRLDARRMAALRACEKLEKLSLTYSAIDESVAAEIAEMESLTHLRLATCGLSEYSVSLMSRLPRLERLDVPGNRLGAPAIHALASSSRLRALDLSNCWLDDVALVGVEWPAALERLDLSFNTALGDAGVAELVRAPRLECLGLYSTGVTNAALEVLCGLPRLRELCLASTAIDDAALPLFQEFAALESVDANGTAITFEAAMDCLARARSQPGSGVRSVVAASYGWTREQRAAYQELDKRRGGCIRSGGIGRLGGAWWP
jgi:hypothetical protein